MVRPVAFAFATALALALPAQAQATPGAQLLEAKEGQLTYRVVHMLHEVTGLCRTLEGRVALLPAATRVQVRAKVACFESGNGNRDVHMREVTHEAVHPFVALKGSLGALKLPLAAALQTKLSASVELNGVKQAVEIPVSLAPEGARVRVKFAFPISLDAFKVERPELLMVRVDDAVVIEGDLVFEPATPPLGTAQ